MSSSPPTLSAPLPPALLRRKEAAAYCGRSVPAWDRMVSAGLTPRPIKLGASVLMRKTDLDLWVSLSCPDRATYDALTA